ncbi:MAG: CBS domain-containing protein [Patescibacteria group bacterium]|jgi:sporulation protein YlmC with PRC-barrel domain
MPYLSHLLNRQVKDSSDEKVGKLQDILVIPKSGEYPALEFLAILKAKSKDLIFIPYEYVETISREEITLKNLYNSVHVQERVAEGLVYLKKDVLDQQIVDIAGVRVVRVNDLRIGVVNDQMSVLGIDVGMGGILRRLGIDWLGKTGLLKVNLIDWRQTKFMHGLLKLDRAQQKLNKLHPADLANIVEDLNLRHGSKLVVSLDADSAARVLEEVDPNLQKVLVKYLGPEKVAEILTKMTDSEIVDLVKVLPRNEARLFLSQIKSGQLKKIEQLLSYPDNTAGGLMNVDFATVRPGWTIQEALKEVKNASPKLRSVLYVYVTDEDGYYHGKFSLRWLVISPPEMKIRDILKHYPHPQPLHPHQKIKDIAATMTKYNLLTAPVLDSKHRLLGIVTIDDVMSQLLPKA